MKILSLLLVSFGFFCCEATESWQEKWTESVLILEEGILDDAKKPLDEAVTLLEKENNHDYPYLYVDQARLNLLLKNYEEGLINLKKAFSNDKLTGKEKLRALTTLIMMKGATGQLENVLDDLKEFQTLAELPTFDCKNNKKLIFRNIPNNDYYKKLMTCYLIHAGLCYDKDELHFLSSDMLIGESHCGCPNCIAAYSETRECDACHVTVSPTKKNMGMDELTYEFIKYCSAHVIQLNDQIACLKAICQIRNIGACMEFFPDTLDHIFDGIYQDDPYWD